MIARDAVGPPEPAGAAKTSVDGMSGYGQTDPAARAKMPSSTPPESIMTFRITGLSPESFQPLFELSDEALQRIGARRVIADDPRMPCRVSMAHAELGEELLLLNYAHQPANTPYRATHAIYVRKLADRPFESIDSVPEVLASRLIAVRAFDEQHMMIDADVSEGSATGELFARLLDNPKASYLQAHYARRGCYAARVERA